MEQSKLKEILEQHQLWIVTNGVQGERADLRFANFYRANLTRADLQGANLDRANFYRADLSGANLTGANLSGANFYRANLTDANLTGANLTGANLRFADLNRANLRFANLQDAYLTRANLTGANLTDANLQYADLTGAILPDISWIIPGCLVQLNQISCSFYLAKEDKCENFVQDSFGFIVQNNVAEETFDMLVEDRVIRGIPDWVKYSGLKQVLS